jgi:uncharacterized protein YbaR (Trm112 family)
MEEVVIYDGSPEVERTIFERFRRGQLRVLCPECKSDLTVVLDEEAMRREGRHAGIYCPQGHVSVLYELNLVHDRMKELFSTLRQKRQWSTAPVLTVDPDEDGWIACPGCGIRFTLRDRRFALEPELWRHDCGQRIRRHI